MSASSQELGLDKQYGYKVGPLSAVAALNAEPRNVTIARQMDLGIRGQGRRCCSGASRGLGKACAFALAREGVDVTIVARTRDVLERTAAGDQRKQPARRSRPVAGDITTAEGRSAALAACPRPDILLNNADGPLPGDFRDWSREDWIAALDTMMLVTDRDDAAHRRRHDGARLRPRRSILFRAA